MFILVNKILLFRKIFDYHVFDIIDQSFRTYCVYIKVFCPNLAKLSISKLFKIFLLKM